MNKEWLVDLVARLPQGLMSRGWGWIARQQRPRLGVKALKAGFVMGAGIDMTEAAADIDAYPSLEDLFIRKLRAGARRVDPNPDALVSPVDGTVGMCGTIENGTLLQVKGRRYSVARLLDDPELAERFDGGQFATIYLAPHNYHRIHAPISGAVSDATLIPGALMPVFPEALRKVDELFARNERVITYIDAPDGGRFAVVKVGATMVGRIRVSYDATVQSNVPNVPRRSMHYDPAKLLNKGQELGVFEIGSTVILLTEPGTTELQLQAGATVRMGERIGTLLGKGSSTGGSKRVAKAGSNKPKANSRTSPRRTSKS